MAHRLFPSDLRPLIVSSAVRPRNPQETLTTVDGTVQIVRRGPGRWEGTLVFGPLGVGRESELRRIEAFIGSLEGRLHTFDVPIFRPLPQLTAGTSLTLSEDVSVSAGLAQISLTGTPAGLKKGEFISIGGQAYQLQSDVSSGAFSALPARAVGGAGDTVVWDKPVQRARLAARGARAARTGPGFQGPWTLTWESEKI